MARPHQKIFVLPKERISRHLPEKNTAISETDHQSLFAREREKNFAEVYWSIYEKVTIVAKGTATSSGSIVSESLHYPKPSFYIKIKSLLRSIFYKENFPPLSKAVLLTDDYSNGYFHWVADVLPKILLLQNFFERNKEWRNTPIFIPHSCYTPLWKQMFAMFSINYDTQCVEIVPKTKRRTQKLLTLGNLTPPYGSGNYRPEIMQKLRKTAQKYIQTQKVSLSFTYTERIYVSRKDANYRYLENEEELAPLLQKYNFTTVEMSQYTFLEQVLLCSKTKILITLHGAALVNMMWMMKGSTVIEIRKAGDTHNNCYFSLAHAMELKYSYILAHTSSNNTQRTNFTVNYADLETILKKTCTKKI